MNIRMRGNDILDSRNSVIGRVRGNDILDSRNSVIGRVRGNDILDSRNSVIGSIDGARKAVEGGFGGVSLAAIWLFFVR